MRIAYLAVEFPTESNYDHGAGVSMGREVLALKELGHEVSVICWAEQDEICSFHGLIVHRVSRRLPLWLRGFNRLTYQAFSLPVLCRWMAFRVWKVFRELHQQLPFDVACAASSAGVAYDSARRMHVPLVIRLSQYQPDWTALDGPHTLSTRLRDRFEVRTLHHADAIWTKSYHMAEVLRAKTGLEAEVIEPPFTVDVEQVDASILDEAGLRDKKFFLCLGPLGRRKGTNIIAVAAESVVMECPDMRFVFVGTAKNTFDGLPAWEWTREHAYGVGREALMYLGKIPREHMFALITHAVATIIAARTDNLPNASYETMGTGNILVASRGASFEQIVEDSVNGYLFDNGDPESLASVLVKIIGMTEQQKQEMKYLAKHRVETMRPDIAGERLVQYFQQIIRNRDSSNREN
jgi:glycosyltransferase involved in cell wall biosynthesis